MVAFVFSGIALTDPTPLAWGTVSTPQQQYGSAAGKAHQAPSAIKTASAGKKPASVAGAAAEAKPRTSTVAPRLSNTPHAETVKGQANARGRTTSPKVGSEVTAKRTATATVFANDDGSYTSRVYSRPVHYQTSAGSWVDIDTTLAQGADGSWQEKANSPAPAFASAGNAPTLVFVPLAGGASIGFGLQGGAAVSASVSGSTVTYPGIAPHADVTYQATAVGAKETLVLHDASAPTTWTFPLRLKGVSAKLGDDHRSVVFTDAKGAVVDTITNGFMQDSKIDPRSGDGAMSIGVDYALDTVGGQPVLRVTLDSAWLHDPTRVFPVRVDPSVNNINTSSSTYVMSPFTNNYSSDAELKVGTYDGGSNVANSYLTFNVGATLPNDYIEAVTLNLDEIWSYSCSPRPVYVAPITSGWSATSVRTYPGLSYGSAIGSNSFAGGTSCSGPVWQSIDLGDNPSAAGTQLVESWTHGGGNLGLAVVASTSDTYAWKRFDSINTSYPPYLSITWSPYGADYSVANNYVQPTGTLGGSQQVTVTNRGNSTWQPGSTALSYQLYSTNWQRLSVTTPQTALPNAVGPNASVTLNAQIGATTPGQYYLCWDMQNSGTSFNQGYGVPTATCELVNSANTPPQIDSTNPPSNVVVGSLTPQLYATGHDQDNYPGNGLTYDFQVYSSPAGGNAPTLVVDSGATSSGSWVVPAGKLSWNQTYSWTVSDSDGLGSSAWSTPAYLSTTVPQPLITSHLGAAATNSSGKKFDPGVGDYTSSATDATVSVPGPALGVTRAYNSLDPRTTNLFGAGWSSVYDMAATPDSDGSGNVVVTSPDGHTVRYGLSSDGATFTPPQGTYSTFAARSGGGYSLTDRGGTTYTFGHQLGGSWQLTMITDANGRAQTLTYGSGNQLSQIADNASSRTLHVSWTPDGKHVAQVVTDPVTSGGASLTWTYSYNGDTLTKVCPPTSTTQCTTYTYSSGSGSGSHYRSTVIDAAPFAYWRFGEASGTAAIDQVAANLGNQNATYSNVSLGNAGPLSGTPSTAASFNGSSSSVALPTGLLTANRYLAVQMWFKTTTGGPLLGYQDAQFGSQATPSNAVPALYVGTDGKLRGQLWTGHVGPITTSQTVTDGRWHHVVLSGGLNTQTLYLDGAAVGSLSGLITPLSMSYEQVGAFYAITPGDWPGYGSTHTQYFSGLIAEAAFYTHALGAPAVTQQYAAGTTAAAELTSVTSPNAKSVAQISYDNVNDRATQVTDAHGGSWKLNAPQTHGSSADYRGAVLANAPVDYWPLSDTSGTQAANVLPAASVEGWNDNDATYNNVTLGQPGVFPGAADTAAGFNGTSSYISVPSSFEQQIVTPQHNLGVALWFKTTVGGGVLFDYQSGPIGSTLSGDYTPALYVGTDGKLYGEFFDGYVSPIASSNTVTDGNWHFAVLAADNNGQQLYLDGTQIGSRSTNGGMLGFGNEPYVSLGAGYISGLWPAQPTNNVQGYFTGSIAQVAGYVVPISSTLVGQWYTAAHASGGPTPATTVTVTDPGNATLRYVYDPGNGGRLMSTADGLGNTTSYSYDTNGFLYTTTYPDGNVVTKAHDARGNVLSNTIGDAWGNATSYDTYVAAGTYTATDPRNDEPTAYRNPDSSGPTDTTYQTSYTYSSSGNVLSATNPVGATTTYSYTAGSETAVGGGVEPAGLLASRKDPLGAVTTYIYDSAGDLAQVTSPLGLKTTYGYDNLGRRSTQTQVSDTFPNGITTTYTYDGNSRLLSQTNPAVTDAVTGTTHTRRTSYTYDVDGKLLTSADADTTGGNATRASTYTYDTHDQLATVTDPLGRKTSYGYDAYGNPTSVTDPAGNGYSITFDADGHQLSTTLHGWTGNSAIPASPTDLTLDSRAYDPDGLLAADTDAMGRTRAFAYDQARHVVSVSLEQYGNSTNAWLPLATYQYDPAGNITQQTAQPPQIVTNYTLDPAARVTAETFDPYGVNRTTTTTYDADNNVTSRAVANGSVNEEADYTYDAIGDLTGQTVRDGATNLTTSWTYDQRGLPTSTVDPRGNLSGATPANYTTSYTHDAAGQLTTTVRPTVSVESNGSAPTQAHPIALAGYDTFGDQTSTSDPDGNITSYTYDADAELLAVSRPAYTPPGSSTPITPTRTQTYDSLGQVASVTDPNGNITAASYDQLGDIVQLTLPTVDGHAPVWQYSYDNDSERLSSTDPTGAQTQATYDTLGQQLTSTQIVRQPTTVANTTTYSYIAPDWNLPGAYPLGDPATITQPGGQQSTFTYDYAGNVLSSKDPVGNTTTNSYDVDGHLTKTQLPDGTATTFTYDPAGRPVGTAQLDTTGTTVASTSATYDAAGNPASTTNATGATTTYTFDPVDNLTQRVEPVSNSASITTSYGHDAAGQTTRYTDGDGNATTVTYNSQGMPESRIAPHVTGYTTAVDSTSTLSYDADRHVTARSLPGGVGHTMTYDALGRLTSQTGSGAQATTATRTLGYDLDGRVTSVSTPTGNNTYTYDDRGAVLTSAGPGGTNTFSYNGNGQVTSRTDKAGTATFTYDADGRVQTAHDPLTGATATYAYDPVGEVTGVTYGAGAAAQANTYNAQHEVTSQTITAPGGATEASATYSYDANGRITNQTTAGTAGAAATTYGYDQAGRLTSASVAGGATTSYGYDGAGNRTQIGNTTATFNARNQMVSQGATTYSYTARGTLSSRTTGTNATNYSYDAFDELASDGTNTYTYDGLGRLASRGGNTFSYDDTSNSLVGDGTNTYGRGPDGSLMSVSTGAHAALAFTNAHGDLTATFSPTGNTLDGSTAFDAYGQPTATAGNHYGLGYQGGWTNPTTGYVATASRWYSPTQGGFTSQDALLTLDGPAVAENPYAYGDDDPLDNADPSGNSSCSTSRPAKSRASGGARAATAAAPARGAAPAPDDSINEAEDYGFEGAQTYGYTPSYSYSNPTPGWDEEGNLWGGDGRLLMRPGQFEQFLENWFGGGADDFAPELGFATSGECTVTPSGPTAEQGINEKPINLRPSGQSAPANELGTKDGNSGPADAPVNLDTQAEANPAEQAGETPFHGSSQPTSLPSELNSGELESLGESSASEPDGPVGGEDAGGPRRLRGADGRFKVDPDRPDPDSRYDRVKLRETTKRIIRDDHPKDEDGNYLDPNDGSAIPKEGPFHYGHKPSFEYWRNRDMARLLGWDREQFIEFENDPGHYQIEDPDNNMSHQYEQH